MKKKTLLFLFLLALVITLPLTNRRVRVFIFAQQQQDILEFGGPTEESVTPTTTELYDDIPTDTTQQVDWVFDNLGRCWNAWSAPSCGLQQHEGGVTVPSMKDLDHDGIEDITCSVGGTINGTTITNTSNKTITINCERYTCSSCTSGNGIHAQCDGGIDPTSDRIVETVDLTPGCVATCTLQGAVGTCLEEKQPNITPPSSPAPTNVVTTAPTTAPTAIPTPEPTTIPLKSPTPTPIDQVDTPTAPPTTAPARTHLPVSIDYSSYVSTYNQFPPTYVYAMLNRTYNAQSTERGINGLKNISGNVVKMIMISEYNALEQILNNHSEEIRAAGITWVGYNAERDGRTPESELQNIFSPNASTNVINKMGKLTDRFGLKLMLGPTTPMWNEYFNRSDKEAVAQAMIGDNCYLDGIAFQEQKQISRTNKAERASVVGSQTSFFREQANNCPEFESMVQIMSSWCEQNATWEECRGYYRLLKDLEGPSRVNSLAIWASGDERNDLPTFIEFLRQ